MRKLTLLILFAMAVQVSSYAQTKMYPNAINVKVNVLDYGILYNNEARISEGFEFAYYRNIAPFLNVGIPFKLGLAKLPLKTKNTATASFDLIFRLENQASSSKILPYAFGGAGYIFEKSNNHVQIPFGAGVNFKLSPYAFISLQAEYRKALIDDRDNIQVGLGYHYLLHPMEVKPEPKPINIEMIADKDRDGILDSLDHCPDIAGPESALGCPDGDGDGLGDTEDPCPSDAGTLETNGCPDFDGDGVADKEDECPKDAGTWNGCPDKDFDGVADKNDKCPDESGPESNEGCPTFKDTDGDGTSDDVDECPELAGPNKGCPDSDGDGIADNHDKCPSIKGSVENNGCPDAPVEKEIDTDGDNIPDRLDKCPNEAGLASNDGCMPDKDTDGDGTPDSSDACPDKAGKINGCPDTDGDGIADNVDKCPTAAGIAANSGCPEIKQEVKEKLAFATKAVQFETGKASLKPESFNVLDEVVNILRTYPEYILAISGHTDNVGNDDRNLKLSQDRAKTCFDYLVFRGIKAERLRHAGFGEARPLTDNSSVEGREMNRRVDFEVIFE